MDSLFTWYPASRPPTRNFQTENDLKFIAELESGYIISAEYDLENKVYVGYCQRYDGEPGLLETGNMTPDLVDESLSWEPEETEDIVRWMWIPKHTEPAE